MLVWGTAAVFYMLAMFHRMSLAVASLDASERLGIGVDRLALLSALQLALYLALVVPVGLMVDRIGARLTLASGLATMALGEALFALATAPGPALVGRGLVGAGDALIFLCVLRVAQAWFAPGRYAQMALLTATAGAIGHLATTVPLGGALDVLGWTPVFLGSAIVTALAAIVCLVVIRDHPPGVTAPPPVAGRLGERLRAVAGRWATRRAIFTHLSLMGPFVAVSALWGYPWLVEDRGLSEGAARLALLGCVAACAVGGPVAGVAVARHPHWRDRITAGTALAVAAGWLVALLWPGGSPAAVAIAALVATGLTCSAAMLAFDIARAGNPVAQAGLATGVTNTGGFGAAVALQLTVGALVGPLGLTLSWGLLAVPVLMLGGVAGMFICARAQAHEGQETAAPTPVAAAESV